MERFLDLCDVALMPSIKNQGIINNPKFNFSVEEKEDVSVSLSYPIFTAPVESIVGENSFVDWQNAGIRPVIPRSEKIETRMELCKWVFVCFTIPEVRRYFINTDLHGVQNQFHICIDNENGHSEELFEVGKQLKSIYRGQVLLMGGNLINPAAYTLYSKAGFDFIRVGVHSYDSSFMPTKYGFDYPIASLLIDLGKFIKSSGAGLRYVKIIADCTLEDGITDILKALACGADYVMVSEEFAHIVEAEGRVVKKEGPAEKVDVPREKILGMSGNKAAVNGLQRAYYDGEPGKEASESQSWKFIDIDSSLKEWIDDFKESASFAFMMSGSLSWEEFKKNIIVERIK